MDGKTCAVLTFCTIFTILAYCFGIPMFQYETQQMNASKTQPFNCTVWNILDVDPQCEFMNCHKDYELQFYYPENRIMWSQQIPLMYEPLNPFILKLGDTIKCWSTNPETERFFAYTVTYHSGNAIASIVTGTISFFALVFQIGILMGFCCYAYFKSKNDYQVIQ